jgi:Cu(I)/Ag(I) efflux system membrane protein CusA/SilA
VQICLFAINRERPDRSRSQQKRSKRNIVDAGVQRAFRVVTRLLGAIELANGLCANEPGPQCLRFVVLLGAAFQLEQRLKLILPVVFFVIFLLLYIVFHSVAEALVLIFPTIYALTGGLLLQYLLGYNFSVAVWVGYIALFGIAVETGVVMVVYLHEALERHTQGGHALTKTELEAAVIEGAVQRLRPKLMTVTAVLASLVPILWESGIGSDVMRPIAAPIVGGMITSTIHVLILVPIFFMMMKERAISKTANKENL